MDEHTMNDREAILREFVMRLSTFPGDPRVNNPRLLLEQMPGNLPFEIPLPPDSRVLGTLIRGPENADIILDAAQPPEQVIAWYRERMKQNGIEELEQPTMGMRGGFTHTRFNLENRATFCFGSHGPSLNVAAYAKDDDSTISDVRLDLDMTGQQCAQRKRMSRMHHHPIHDFFPPLKPPAGTQQTGGGGGSGGNNSMYSTATLTMNEERDLAELGAHYASQLEQGGWTRLDEGSNGPVAWSRWTYRDEDNELWNANFLILKTQEQQPQYQLYIQATMDESSPPPRGGWFSSYAPLG